MEGDDAIGPRDAFGSRVVRMLLPRGPLRSLRHPEFRTFWVAHGVTQLGFWMANVALQWLIARLTGNDSFALGLLYFFNLVPLLLLSPWAGVIADRHDRQRVVALSQVLVCVLCIAIVVQMVWAGSTPVAVVYAFAFGIGTFLAVGAPSSQAIVVNAVPRQDLMSAVGLQAASLNVARVAGPGLATPFLVGVGPAPVFAAYAAASGIAAWAMTRLRLPPIPRLDGVTSTWARVVEGLHHVRQRPAAGRALILVAGTSVLSACYVSQLAVVAYEHLHGDDRVFGTLVVATGVGALVGAMVSSARSTVPRVEAVAVQMIALSALLLPLSASRFYPLVVALAAVVATLNFSIMTGLNIVLQSVVEEHSRGRVMSLYILAWGGLIPIGALLLGTLAAQVGLFVAMCCLGACQVVLATTMGAHSLWRRRS